MASRLFKISVALTGVALAIPFLCSCQPDSSKQETKPKSHFLGFQDNILTYQYPKLGGESTPRDVKIIRISENYYRTSEPIDLFTTTSNQDITFTILTSSPNDSMRARYFLDDSTPNHSIKILGSTVDYLDKMPDYYVTNPELKYDKLFVNFECDKNVFLEINCRIWVNSFPQEGIFLTYSKQSDDDLHYVMYDGLLFRSVVVCPSNGVEEDIHRQIRIICKPQTEYQFCNIYVDIQEPPTTSIFSSCIVLSAVAENFVVDNTSYSVINIDYTILKKVTPTKEEAKGVTPDLFVMKIVSYYPDEPISNRTTHSSVNEYDVGTCNFSLLWE